MSRALEQPASRRGLEQTTTSLTRPHGQRHSEEDIETGLTEVALCAGSTTRASAQLAERDIHISRAVLEQWKNRRHTDRYVRIRDQQAAAIQRRIAAMHEDLAQRSVTVAYKALDLLEQELPNIPPRDLAGALRNIATTAGISADKIMLLRERPLPAPAPTRDVTEIVRRLESMGVLRQDIPDAEVIEEPADGGSHAA